MAQTVKFDGCNKRYSPPEGVSEEQCASIDVFRNGACTVSAWKPSSEELVEINRTGLVWLSIWSSGLPPAYVGSETETHKLVADFGPVWPLSKQPSERKPTYEELEAEIKRLRNSEKHQVHSAPYDWRNDPMKNGGNGY